MAEETPTKGSWRGGCLGCAGVLLAFLGVLSFAIAWQERGVDPDRLCAPRETESCIRIGTGSVESTNGILDRVTIRYDDGRRTQTVTLEGADEPPAGSRLRLEWWDDEIVALYDLDRDRGYRTLDWPDPWWEWAAFFAFCAVLVGLALGAVFGTDALVRRRRTAAKPPSRTESRGAP